MSSLGSALKATDSPSHHAGHPARRQVKNRLKITERRHTRHGSSLASESAPRNPESGKPERGEQDGCGFRNRSSIQIRHCNVIEPGLVLRSIDKIANDSQAELCRRAAVVLATIEKEVGWRAVRIGGAAQRKIGDRLLRQCIRR